MGARVRSPSRPCHKEATDVVLVARARWRVLRVQWCACSACRMCVLYVPGCACSTCEGVRVACSMECVLHVQGHVWACNKRCVTRVRRCACNAYQDVRVARAMERVLRDEKRVWQVRWGTCGACKGACIARARFACRTYEVCRTDVDMRGPRARARGLGTKCPWLCWGVQNCPTSISQVGRV